MRSNSRIIEVLKVFYRPRLGTICYWNVVPFKKLRKGDIFRAWDFPKGKTEGRIPDEILDGQHVICVALEDPRKCNKTLGVKCEPLRGFTGPKYSTATTVEFSKARKGKELKDGRGKETSRHRVRD